MSYAPVPFESPWYRPLLQPLVVGSNLAVAAWMYPCWRTARTLWRPPLDVLSARLADAARPVIYYTWHAYELLGACAFRDVPEPLMPVAIGHDGVRSRMLQQAFRWCGVSIWVYRRQSPIRPKQQIIDLLRSGRGRVALAADAGGPYRRVKPGLPEIAQAADALLVPFVIRGRGVLPLRRPVRYDVPLPFCSLVLYYGAPFDGRDATVAACQRALEDQEGRARQSALG
ncbi:MAG: hypothetical protein GTN62_10010 [Gemmatimonadales bacterium]|nr:hypothetical protein [Gemmatimonadales bacterium]NIN11879.1 hypothetical protein [Gemmatimonadales bacterium]NIN50429.1 hypothetical protein [Gemmatimonadales bacterium]NIP07893.1 hypothetical protein [Gemmatimonadales bacterium]NIR01917.1 hypothetical protein [Gemmatimonadales bacterium]